MPQRDLIVFVTFVVILVSLIGPVLTMPALVRLIGIEDDGGADREDAKARIKAAEAALARIEEIAEEGWANDDSLERARGQYRFRTNRFSARLTGEDGDGVEERSVRYQRLRRELLDAERTAVLALRNQGLITEEVTRRGAARHRPRGQPPRRLARGLRGQDDAVRARCSRAAAPSRPSRRSSSVSTAPRAERASSCRGTRNDPHGATALPLWVSQSS